MGRPGRTCPGGFAPGHAAAVSDRSTRNADRTAVGDHPELSAGWSPTRLQTDQSSAYAPGSLATGRTNLSSGLDHPSYFDRWLVRPVDLAGGCALLSGAQQWKNLSSSAASAL